MSVARTLIADDHALVRGGLRLVLDAEPDFDVVAEAADGRQALDRALAEPRLDLAVIDVSMPALTGLQATAELLRRRPGVRVVMLSMHDHDGFRHRAAEAGAAAYVLKSAADRDLVNVCRAALGGGTAGCPASSEPDADGLTARELQVLKLIAEARSGQEIAEELAISPKTVERHRTNLLDKLGARDRVQLTRYAIKRGLVDP